MKQASWDAVSILLMLGFAAALAMRAAPDGRSPVRPAEPAVPDLARTTERTASPPLSNIALADVALPPPPEVNVEPKKAPPTISEPPPRESPAVSPGARASDGVRALLTRRRQASRDRQAGRALLRQLEQDRGPSIEIAWPASSSERDAVYSILTRCHGMKTALLEPGGRFRVEGRTGSFVPDGQRYSGFIRQVVGDLPAAESRVVAAIRAAHPRAGGSVVRLLPREVDAVLLGGLQRVLGSFSETKRVTAKYARKASGLVVGELRVDGVSRPGSVQLAGAGRCAI